MIVSFGNRLKELREERGITMDELIDDLNKKHPELIVSKSVISRYENKKSMPKRFVIVEGLADYFGVSIAYLNVSFINPPIADKKSILYSFYISCHIDNIRHYFLCFYKPCGSGF